MASVTIMKDATGKLTGFGEKGVRAYNRFLKAVRELEIGEMLSFSYKVPRSPKFHRLHFVMLDAFYQQQEQFGDGEQFRKWLEVGAGHCDFVPGPNGRMVALPRSIAYDALDDIEFSDVHEGIKRFLRTEHARRFLWPHLPLTSSADTVDSIIQSFEMGESGYQLRKAA